MAKIRGKFCPMSFNREDNSDECVEGECAWWIVYLPSTDQEWAECAICALGRLYDMPSGYYYSARG